MNYLKKIFFYLNKKINSIFVKSKYLESLNDIQYIIDKNNLKFKFNIIDKYESIKNNNCLLISKNNVNFIKKNISYIDIEKTINNLSNNVEIFFINEKLFNNPYNKILFSWLINDNQKIFLYKNKPKIYFKKIKKFIKLRSIKYWITSNKYNFYQRINLFLNNVVTNINNNIDFFNWKETINALQEKNIIRIGDGEFDLINSKNNSTQKFSNELRNDLIDTINYFNKKNKIAINDKMIAKFRYLNDRNWYQNANCKFILNFKKVYSANLWSINPYELYNSNINFLSTNKTINIDNQLYNTNNNKLYKTVIGLKWIENYKNFFKLFFEKILTNKNVLLVSNKNNKYFLKNDLFNISKKHFFIETPINNAYSQKKQIEKDILDVLSKNKNTMVLLSCGALSKVIAKTLDQRNIKFIDIGNFINYYSYYTENKIDDITSIHKTIFNKK